MPSDVRTEICRDYLPSEVAHIRKITAIDSAPEVQAEERPKVLIVIGPAGAGKSSCLKKA